MNKILSTNDKRFRNLSSVEKEGRNSQEWSQEGNAAGDPERNVVISGQIVDKSCENNINIMSTTNDDVVTSSYAPAKGVATSAPAPENRL